MSVFKREIFKWVRPEPHEAESKQFQVEPIIRLGTLDPKDEVVKLLHTAAIHGRRKQLTEVLQTGIWVDFPNSLGQTPLFVATLRGQWATVEHLLKEGANPNEKSENGTTPVHVACMKSSLRAVGAMVSAGGDLRLHDNAGNSCLDWAMLQPSARKRMKLVSFLQKTQLFALNYSGDFLGHGGVLERQPSILQMLRGKVSSQMSLDLGNETGLRRVQSFGYGRVYLEGDTVGGLVSVIPLITETQLHLDGDGMSFESSSCFFMTSMLWGATAVTVKRPDKELIAERMYDLRGSIMDLLITEVEHLSKLRHPQLLLLMGMCQASTFDSIMLVFERVYIGSVYHILHVKRDHMPMTYIRDILIQMCQALLYLHAQNYIHCSLSSYSIQMVSMHQAKLTNLEFMVEMKKAATGRPCTVATSPHNQQFFRWMAPEIMLGQAPCVASDIYSLCCVMYEMISSEMLWRGKNARQLIELHEQGKGKLPTLNTVVLFQDILSQGLDPDIMKRQMNVETLFQQLEGPLDKPAHVRVKSHKDTKKSMQKASKKSIFAFGADSLLNQDELTASAGSSELSVVPSTLNRPSHTENLFNYNLADMNVSATPLEKEDASSATGTKTISVADSDTTNNHSRASQQKSSDNSSSTLENTDYQMDAVDGRPIKPKHSSGGRFHTQPTTMSLGRTKGVVLPRGMDVLKYASERSSSCSGLGKLQKYSRRTASLPWQGPAGLLKSGRRAPSPGRGSRTLRHTSDQEQEVPLEISLTDRSGKTLPPVKPASHCTDIKEFVKGDYCSTSSLQPFNVPPMKTQISRRSLPSRNRSPRLLGRSATRSHSALSDMVDSPETPPPLDVGLAHPGCVRTLKQQFQAHIYNHHLRQSILKGSMTPQGTIVDDLNTSPTSLPLSPDSSEVPPEGTQKKAGPDSSNDREVLTGSTKGSTESLTSVSTHDDEDDEDDSYLDDDECQSYPLTSPKELDVTEEAARPRSTPDYIYEVADTRKKNLSKKSASQKHEDLGSRRSMSPGYDDTDGQAQGRYIGFEHMSIDDRPKERHYGFENVNVLQFLPQSRTKTDVSSNPFDFQDYYIDDDYTGMNDGDKKLRISPDRKPYQPANYSDRSRRRYKDPWAAEGKNASGKYKQNTFSASASRDYVDGRNSSACFVVDQAKTRGRPLAQEKLKTEQIYHVKEKAKFTNYRDKFLAGARKVEAKKISPSGSKSSTDDYHSYRKADQWLEEDLHLDLENLKDAQKKEKQRRHARDRAENDHATQAHAEKPLKEKKRLDRKMEAHWPHEMQWTRNPKQRRSDPWLKELKETIKPMKEGYRPKEEDFLEKNTQLRKTKSEVCEKTTQTSSEDLSASENVDTTEEEGDTYTIHKVHNDLDVARQLDEETDSEDRIKGVNELDHLDDLQFDREMTLHDMEEICLEAPGHLYNEQTFKSNNEHAIDDDSTLERIPDDDLQDTSNDISDDHVLQETSDMHDGVKSQQELDTSAMSEENTSAVFGENTSGENTSALSEENTSAMSGEDTSAISGGQCETVCLEDDTTFNTTESHEQNETGGFDYPDSTFNMTTVTPALPEDPLSCSVDAYTSCADSSMCTVVDTSAADYLSVSDNTAYDTDKTLAVLTEDEEEDGDSRDQRRCILLNLERNIRANPEPKKSPDADQDEAEGDGSTNVPEPSQESSTVRKFYLGSGAGSQGYTTTLRVESSLQSPGSHRITHTACDTSTGLTQTVHEETVEAETLRTTMSIK